MWGLTRACDSLVGRSHRVMVLAEISLAAESNYEVIVVLRETTTEKPKWKMLHVTMRLAADIEYRNDDIILFLC